MVRSAVKLGIENSIKAQPAQTRHHPTSYPASTLKSKLFTQASSNSGGSLNYYMKIGIIKVTPSPLDIALLSQTPTGQAVIH